MSINLPPGGKDLNILFHFSPLKVFYVSHSLQMVSKYLEEYKKCLIGTAYIYLWLTMVSSISESRMWQGWAIHSQFRQVPSRPRKNVQNLPRGGDFIKIYPMESALYIFCTCMNIVVLFSLITNLVFWHGPIIIILIKSSKWTELMELFGKV